MAIVRFIRKIRESGGSAAIVIPPEILKALGWLLGDEIELHIEDGKLIIEKSKGRGK